LLKEAGDEGWDGRGERCWSGLSGEGRHGSSSAGVERGSGAVERRRGVDEVGEGEAGGGLNRVKVRGTACFRSFARTDPPNAADGREQSGRSGTKRGAVFVTTQVARVPPESKAAVKQRQSCLGTGLLLLLLPESEESDTGDLDDLCKGEGGKRGKKVRKSRKRRRG
jgi:hypothetical protein